MVVCHCVAVVWKGKLLKPPNLGCPLETSVLFVDIFALGATKAHTTLCTDIAREISFALIKKNTKQNGMNSKSKVKQKRNNRKKFLKVARGRSIKGAQ